MKKKEKCYEVKGVFVNKEKEPLKGIRIKAYDKKGKFLATGVSDKKGLFKIECSQEPAVVKAVYAGKIRDTQMVTVIGSVVDLGSWIICWLLLGQWHIAGVVKEKSSGTLLSGLTVEAFDVDYESQGGPYYDPLGECVTDATGRFNIWFYEADFERDEGLFGNQYPDVLLRVRNAKGTIVHETEIDYNVSGTPHDCASFCKHKGKEYTLEIDYVTTGISHVGPVPAADIKNTGLVDYDGISDRPFGGKVTVHGRIWGTQVAKWRLSYGDGFIDSADPRIGTGGPDPFNTVAEGTNRVWDGPIASWATGSLEAVKTIILVVWDESGNSYHDTQVVYLHNQNIAPAAEIHVPSAGGVLRKSDGTSVDIEGIASDDYFRSYGLRWGGCDQTELTSTGISYPPAGNTVAVDSPGGKLGTWDIGALVEGPYFVRLGVSDRTILNDGAHTRMDHTWHTLNIAE